MIQAILCVAAGILWRMGGAAGYDKLWRRLGSSAAMLVLITTLVPHVQFEWAILSYALLAWGCWSYFGWLNYVVRPWWGEIEMDREYWWNFWLENLAIQMSILPYKCGVMNFVFAFGWAGVVAFGKVWIDRDENPRIDKDVVSELWHGSGNALGLVINSFI